MEENSLLDGELGFQENKLPILAKAGESGDLGVVVVSMGLGLSGVCLSTFVMETAWTCWICVVVLVVVVVVVTVSVL